MISVKCLLNTVSLQGPLVIPNKQAEAEAVVVVLWLAEFVRDKEVLSSIPYPPRRKSVLKCVLCGEGKILFTVFF